MFLGELREESSDKVECCYGGLVGYAPPPKWTTGSKGHVLDPVDPKTAVFDLFVDAASNSLNRPAVPST